MKKIMMMAAMLLTVMTGFAQDKPVVCVAVFDNATGLSGNKVVANNLRNEVMQGIMATSRVEVLDITTQNLPSNKNELLEALKEKGVEYLLEGKLNSIVTSLAYNKKDRAAEVNFTLTVTEVATKLTKASKTYKETGVGANNDAAILSAAADARKNMDRFVDDHFKIGATIKTLDEIDEKKNAVKTCYVTIGSAVGIQKGQIMEVFKEVEVAGEQVSKKIGELKAKEVLSGTLTLCDVKSGGDVIKKTFEEGTPMTVSTRATKDTFGLRKLMK